MRNEERNEINMNVIPSLNSKIVHRNNNKNVTDVSDERMHEGRDRERETRRKTAHAYIEQEIA